ncbi:GDSL-type esterase/lipase family protein [Parasphingopyxis marina]|uniref:SGNH/GDSL hydrolase family protein n=1 Tax=Parasphingopyxis marina TaxID=2761622 RepID=A0A842HWX1_9SPHN|nr:GDSL-type esterase/lipase family protein [Parasphingopyxis marina]MBC2776831.1 SGNH/GDSL hydrolase family protein [Parasphingopyxis marina]
MRAAFALLALATIAGAGPAAGQQAGSAWEGCGERLCYAQNLAPFFARLGESRRDGGEPVRIIQIGDSHTAGDMITNGWREALRERYGQGGRGVLAAGRPYAGYLTWGVTASQTAGWEVNSIFGRGYANYGRPIGISGFSQTARAAGESLGVTADAPEQSFDRIIVCAIREPGAGTVTLRLGFETERWALDAPERTTECRTLDSDYPQLGASLRTEDDRIVTVTSFATMRRQGGVSLSNLGVSGSQLVHQARSTDTVAQVELRTYQPDLLVFAFGTNEGFSQQLTPASFEATLRAQVTRFRQLMGRDVPILLIGAPDANTRNRGLADNFGAPVACAEGWYTPTLLAELRTLQRRVAREMGLAFWDWNAAMGGRCSAHDWRTRDLMRGDHVHFNQAGGARIGRMIFADLERAAGERAPR